MLAAMTDRTQHIHRWTVDLWPIIGHLVAKGGFAYRSSHFFLWVAGFVFVTVSAAAYHLSRLHWHRRRWAHDSGATHRQRCCALARARKISRNSGKQQKSTCTQNPLTTGQGRIRCDCEWHWTGNWRSTLVQVSRIVAMDFSSKSPANSADNGVCHIFHALEKGTRRLEAVSIHKQCVGAGLTSQKTESCRLHWNLPCVSWNDSFHFGAYLGR